jgi:hypothetical protein
MTEKTKQKLNYLVVCALTALPETAGYAFALNVIFPSFTLGGVGFLTVVYFLTGVFNDAKHFELEDRISNIEKQQSPSERNPIGFQMK